MSNASSSASPGLSTLCAPSPMGACPSNGLLSFVDFFVAPTFPMTCYQGRQGKVMIQTTAHHNTRAHPCVLPSFLPSFLPIAEDVDPPPSASGWGVQGPCLSGCGIGWQVKWLQQQRGLARYNCADSLDRTNVGSFFGAVQVRQCKDCMRQTWNAGHSCTDMKRWSQLDRHEALVTAGQT
eukprot:1133533-Pelagomonas_calceolata.AAC.9